MYTKDYIKQLQSLHNDASRPQGFGGKVKKLGKFHFYMKKWKPSSLLDYGCGKGNILNHLIETYPNTEVHGYDPAIKIFNRIQKNKYECVFSNDVLEHIEPEMLKLVLTHINDTSTKYIWLRIDTLPARKKLPDGRNAHLIIEGEKFWTDNITNYIEGTTVYRALDKKGKLDVAIEK